VANKEFDIYLALAFGVIGYVFKKLDYPLAPLVLAMVLGDKAEDAFRQAMISAEGSASIFWSNPLVTTMMLVGFVLLSLPLLSTLVRKKPAPASLAEQSA
jgi:TctA family transporter